MAILRPHLAVSQRCQDGLESGDFGGMEVMGSLQQSLKILGKLSCAGCLNRSEG